MVCAVTTLQSISGLFTQWLACPIRPAKPFHPAAIHFAIMKKQFIYEKSVDLVEWKMSRKNNITQDVRPSNCFAIAYVVLSQTFWKVLVYMNWIASHRRVDEVVTFGSCKINNLLFADELVLHAWIFSTGSSARI